MPVTPDGLPAWTRTATISQYGGHVDKQNYLSRGLIDPLTDIGAEGYSRLVADVAAAVMVAPMGVFTFLNRTAASGDPPLVECAYFMPSGPQTVAYEGDDPPDGFPAAAQIGAGHVRFTFDAQYADPYGVQGAFTPQHAGATGHGVAFVSTTCEISGQTVDVYCFDASGSAIESKRVTLEVG